MFLRGLRVIVKLLILFLLHDMSVYPHKREEVLFPDSKYGKLESSDDTPILFWWTARLDASVRGSHGFNKLNCPSSTCLTTNDRKHIKDKRAMVFMFYGTDLEPRDLPLPRKENHYWALFHEESPMNNYILSHGTFINLFNFTATFRRESDFPITSQYIPSSEYLTNRQPVSLSEKNKYRLKGFAPIIYVQSHCDVASDRDRYVLELMKHVPIDSYGKCVRNKALPQNLSDPVEQMHTEDFLKFIAKYKFHLSFENALCKDYMTEKLFRTLHTGSVPVYRGSAYARDYMPNNNSIIMVDEFSSPKKLAEYLLFLDEHDSEYLSYLSYKTMGISNAFLIKELNERPFSTNGVVSNLWEFESPQKPDMMNGYECYICETINKRQKKLQTDNGDKLRPQIASANHLHCPQPYPSIGHPETYPHTDRWLQMAWIEDYWSSLDKAIAVKRMLAKNESSSILFDQYWNNVTLEYKRTP